MLHLLCIGGLATTSVAGGATLSYNQLAGADPASCGAGSSRSILELAGRLISRPLGIGSYGTQTLRRTRLAVVRWQSSCVSWASKEHQPNEEGRPSGIRQYRRLDRGPERYRRLHSRLNARRSEIRSRAARS